jgi:endonuclease-3
MVLYGRISFIHKLMARYKVFKDCIDKENWYNNISFTEYATKIVNILTKTYPNARTELDYLNSYTFVIAVLLSAQATDKSVNKATCKLFKMANNPQAMLNLGLNGIREYIKSIGLHNTKAKHIMELSQILCDKYNAQVPLDRDTLEALPGIGRKSANVIMNQLCNAPYIAVDTHVMRLSHRLRLVNDKAKNPLAVEKELYRNIPAMFHCRISNLLVLHGRYICTAKKPKCRTCPLCNYCPLT